MKFSKFSELVNRILSNNHIHRRDMDVTIVVHSPGSIGSTPSVEVQSIHAGFDWDSGKVLIFPAQPLTTLTPEQITDITDSVCKGQSWHAYQEYRKHKEQLDKLSNELEAAKSKLNEQHEYYEGVIADGSKRIAEMEVIKSAAEKLVRCKGRYHREQNYRALAALFGVTVPDLPPLENKKMSWPDAFAIVGVAMSIALIVFAIYRWG